MHWPQHNYSCRLNRRLHAVDDLVRACQTSNFPRDDEVHVVFGFKNFVSASDRLRLFALYCSTAQRFGVDDDELRRAWHANKLKDFLLFRGSQSSDVHIQPELQWLSLATCGSKGACK